MKVEVKAKGKLRADAIMTVDLNDELSLLYSGESSIDGDSLGYQYFNMLEKIVSPLDEIVRNLELFMSITSDDCPDLYKKDKLELVEDGLSICHWLLIWLLWRLRLLGVVGIRLLSSP